LVGILTNLRRCHLQTCFLKVDFCQQNQPNDSKIGCKFPSNLVELFERDINFKKEFEKFEREFEKDEVVEV
jgi:hypothetical protein